jgi:hypothetical protein
MIQGLPKKIQEKIEVITQGQRLFLGNNLQDQLHSDPKVDVPKWRKLPKYT